MRMQLSAPWFVEQVRKLNTADRWFDAVLCSTFVDVALLRVLLQQEDGWNPVTRFCTYFHENQFAYPGQVDDRSIQQFMAINFTTAMASDRLAFNSAFNMETFLEGCRRYVKRAADMCILEKHSEIVNKSIVLHPGMDYSHIDVAPEVNRHDIPVIVWNHRWEHDKNPEEFFTVLQSLKRKGCHFKLILLGQSFRTQPQCFIDAREDMADRIIHYGFAESISDYGALLKQGDIVVSTALHEFFGISVLEAVRAGCTPLLPARLSYPELFPEDYLYNSGKLEKKLNTLISSGSTLSREMSRTLTEPHSWLQLAGDYNDWLLN